MKKAKLFFSLTLTIIFALFILSGCSNKSDKISSIALKDNNSNTPIETVIGGFNCSDYTLLVSYESGDIGEIALAEEMIDEADLFKLYQEGEHNITVSYNGQKCTFKIAVKRATFGTLKFPENNVFTYNGKTHTVEVEGDIPANATVTYPSGNSFANAGTYDLTAIISCEGYVTVKLATTVKIERAKYDMSGITFESKEIAYDGQSHSLEISGTLPEGVSAPTYSINGSASTSAIDAGEYKITATFSSTNPNYEAIPAMEATLKITPAEYNVEGIDIVFKNDNGVAIEGTQKTYDGMSVLFDINDYSKLTKKGSVSFSVYDANGTLISASNAITNIKNAGIYTVKAEITLIDHKNFIPIEPITRTFEIKKAKYDMSKIHFDSDLVEYDGEGHNLAVEISPEIDVRHADVTYEYYLGGKLVASGNDVKVTEAGEYTVKAIFNVKNENYEPIADMEAILKIEQRD